MAKKVLTILVIFFGLCLIAKPVMAQEKKAVVHFFWGKGCPHCAKEEIFLGKLVQKYSGLEIKDYEVTQNPNNLELLKKAGQELSAEVAGVPFTIIGEHYFAGYYDDDSTGRDIEEAVKCALENGCQDVINKINQQPSVSQELKLPLDSLKLPIIGEIALKNLSLPILTLVIALIDGFNPCAMWTLIFLISLLLGMKDRQRMWILGSAFIVASASMYLLFLSAWLNLFLFLGFIVWVRLAIGLVALVSGSYYVREYFTNPTGACRVTEGNKRQQIFARIKAITQKKQFWLALVGIIVLAWAVNLVELICSAGLPAIYTQILSRVAMARWQYYGYLVFYILIFMLDDLIVFFTAMITLKAVGLQGKYSHFSHLIGGSLMLIIGLLLFFKPEWLMFG